MPTPTTTDRTPATLDARALQERLGGPTPPRVLDVRTPGEFESAHIPGSYLVPLDTLREHREELTRHLDEDVVLVCRTGGRATQAEEALATAGLPNLRVLDGGISAWQSAGGDVRRGRERWDLERQVRLVAGSIVLASGLGSVVAPRLKWLATAIGAGLTGAALTNTCAMGMALSKLPYNRADEPDIEDILAELADDPAGS
jgi:rhodanese-related sulfurtransferase